MTTQPDPFDTAEYYDWRDSETLTDESVEECLENLFDFWHVPGESIAASIDKHSPVTINAYAREIMSEDWVDSMGSYLLETLQEQWADNFGDPDGDDLDVTPGHMATLVATVRLLIQGWAVWRCEKVAEREYDADEVEKILRAQCPHWFKEEASAVHSIDVAVPDGGETPPADIEAVEAARLVDVFPLDSDETP
jgi:hypothetical protein